MAVGGLTLVHCNRLTCATFYECAALVLYCSMMNWCAPEELRKDWGGGGQRRSEIKRRREKEEELERTTEGNGRVDLRCKSILI